MFSVDCFPLTSSDSDFQFRVRPLPTPQGIMSFLCVISSASRTHEPCVPTGQVISRMLMRRHNMTSLRSLYVPHGSLLPTTYYPQGAAPKVACHWAMDFIPFREVSPMSISFRMALLTTNYSLLTDIAPHGISVN